MNYLRTYKGTNFITGMRAWAALAVVMIHSGGAGLRSFGQFGNNLANLGSYGVIIFFVISGYSVTVSYLASHDYREYILRRFIRLSSLYYPILLFILGLYFIFNISPNTGYLEKFEIEIDLYNIFLHFSYLSFLDYKVTNSLTGVEWSIGIEAFYYVFLPLLILQTRSIFGSNILILFGILSFFLVQLIAHKVLPNLAEFFTIDWDPLIAAWHPLSYLFCFTLGVSAVKIRELFEEKKFLTNQTSNIAISTAIFLLLFLTYIDFKYILLAIACLTMIIIIFANDQSCLSKYLFKNRLIIFLGTISYSIYLIHFMVMSYQLIPKNENNLIYFIYISAITIFISSLTYLFLEEPMNKVGKKLSKSHLAE